MASMATRSFIASRCTLEQPQGGTDFRQAAPVVLGGAAPWSTEGGLWR